MGDAPPVIQLLLAENFEGIHSPAGFRRALRGLEPELHRQAAWSLERYQYEDPTAIRPTDLILRPSGALDVFTPLEICRHIRCRFNTAEQFARTVGLIADKIVLPDVFTPRFTQDEWDVAAGEQFTRDMVVLGRIAPLVRAGVITFAASATTAPPDPAIVSQIEAVTDTVLNEVESELTFKRLHGKVEVGSGRLLDPPLHWDFPITSNNRRKTARTIGIAGFRTLLKSDVESIMHAMRSAIGTEAVLASGSRLSVLAVRSAERRFISPGEIEDWEAIRSVHLPWVDRMPVEDVLRLRDDAAIALPRVRALLRQKLAVPGEDTEKRTLELVHELRAEAAEVEAELHALRWTRERGFRTLIGSLGITIAVYGLSTGFVPPSVGLGSLMTLLGIVRSTGRRDDQQRDQLMSRPGYLLIKAHNLMTNHE